MHLSGCGNKTSQALGWFTLFEIFHLFSMEQLCQVRNGTTTQDLRAVPRSNNLSFLLFGSYVLDEIVWVANSSPNNRLSVQI